MIIENLIYNSYKAGAKNLNITITKDEKHIIIEFADDGVGLSNKIENSIDLFELGYSTTGGTGVGLSHAQKTIKQLGGTIEINESYKKGFSIIVRLNNEH